MLPVILRICFIIVVCFMLIAVCVFGVHLFIAPFLPLPVPNGNGVRVAYVGDSITYGARIPLNMYNAYPAQLQTMLGSEYLVGNFGLSGATAQNTSNKYYKNTSAYKKSCDFKPEIVIIMLGSNDSNKSNFIDREKFEQQYAILVESYLQLESVKNVYLAVPIPAYENSYGVDNSILQQYIVPAVKSVASNLGLKVLTNFDEFSDKSLYVDGVHPNKSGAKILAEKFYNLLKEE